MIAAENLAKIFIQGVGYGFAGAMFTGFASWAVSTVCRTIIRVIRG